MKYLYSILTAATLLSSGVPKAQAGLQVSVDFFHDTLESYGDWREVGDYGYCWQPRDVGRDWRPYSDGHWLYTDAGWTWDSDEPYSWAVYHYGRWARVDRIGWVWVPGTEWGPAWVSWRRSPRHVGWAPLPPEAEFSRAAGFGRRVDADYDIGPTNYNFVEVRNFGAPRLRTVIIEPRQNITIISRTINITKVTYVNNTVYNEGPQYEVISRESAQPIRRLKLDRREELDAEPGSVRAEQLRTRVEGDSFRVIALPVDAKPATAPRKLATKVAAAEIDHGWKDAGPPAEVAKARSKVKSEAVAPTDSPTQPPVGDNTAAAPKDGKEKQGKEAMPPDTTPVSVAPPARETNEPAAQPPPVSGKKSKGEKNPTPAQPASDAEPLVAAPEVPAKSKKGETKNDPAAQPPPVNPHVNGTTSKGEKNPAPQKPASEPAPAIAAPEVPTKSRKGAIKNGSETGRVPGEALPKAQVPEETARPDNPKPARTLPPAVIESPRPNVHPVKDDPQPKPEPPATRSIERAAPALPEPPLHAKKPEPPQQPVPAVLPPPPVKEKGNGKAKDEKKDTTTRDAVPK